ncbi:MAG: hypothetical protein AB1578_18050 [Thermodesulfobacteriota bacterium]
MTSEKIEIGRREDEFQTQFPDSSSPPTLLLPWRLDPGFRDLFAGLGFRVLWAETREGARELLEAEAPDLALEYSEGPGHLPVRDLLRECGRGTALFYCQSALMSPPRELPEGGYLGWIDFGFDSLAEILGWFRDALDGEKRRWIEGRIDGRTDRVAERSGSPSGQGGDP